MGRRPISQVVALKPPGTALAMRQFRDNVRARFVAQVSQEPATEALLVVRSTRWR